MNGLPVEQMSREDLEHEVKLQRIFMEMYEKVIRLTCKKATADEAYLWGNFMQFNSEYYLHPEPNLVDRVDTDLN